MAASPSENRVGYSNVGKTWLSDARGEYAVMSGFLHRATESRPAAFGQFQPTVERSLSSSSLPKPEQQQSTHPSLSEAPADAAGNGRKPSGWFWLREASNRDVADYLALRGYFPSKAFTASRFVLFSARASTGGGPYIVEDSYTLKG